MLDVVILAALLVAEMLTGEKSPHTEALNIIEPKKVR
jgi:hypothetical protein